MPHPRLIDRAAIVAAAVDVLNERGLDGLSLHAIAARLGVRQPALYHHISNKDDLLTSVAAEVLKRWHTERVPTEGEPWQAFVARNAHSLRNAMLAVRDGARLIASAGPRSPDVDLAIAQTSLLERSGFTGATAVRALIAVSRYTIGATVEQQTSRDGSTIVLQGERSDDAAVHLAAIVGEVVAGGPEQEFEVGLSALLRGLDLLRTH